MQTSTKTILIIATLAIVYMTHYAEQSNAMMQNYKLCNALNNGDYQATNECADND